MRRFLIISALVAIGCGNGAKPTQAQCEQVAIRAWGFITSLTNGENGTPL